MEHKLYLETLEFKIKKINARRHDVLTNQEVLSTLYPGSDKAFKRLVQDLINQIGQKTHLPYKNKTHGGLLVKWELSVPNRTADFIINGGLTGLEQSQINKDGGIKLISADDIIGLPHFVRIWLPAGTDSGFVFMQKYGGAANIKLLLTELIHNILKPNDLILVERRLKSVTTKERMEDFISKSKLHSISLVQTKRINDTGSVKTQSTRIKLSGLKKSSVENYTIDSIGEDLSERGITISGNEKFSVTALLKNGKEEKTVTLDQTGDYDGFIPNLNIPEKCYDTKKNPIFKKMQKFVTSEMNYYKDQ